MNQKILVPLDGSSGSAAVLPYAEAVAVALQAGLCLMRVTESGSEPGWGIREEVPARLDEQQQFNVESYLSQMADLYRKKGLDTSIRMGTGDPIDRILEAASESEVELVAMSTHGRGGVERLLLGSVADKVVRLGSRPVLLIRADGEKNQHGPVSLRRVMVPLDGSELSEQALPLAARLAERANATLVLVRAEMHLWQRAGEYSPVSNLGEIDEEITQSLNAYLEKVATRLRPAVQVEISSLRGIPEVVLDQFLTESAIDLVVMATHGRGGIRRLAVGSTADRLVRLGVPTLLVRSGFAPRSEASGHSGAAVRVSR